MRICGTDMPDTHFLFDNGKGGREIYRDRPSAAIRENQKKAFSP